MLPSARSLGRVSAVRCRIADATAFAPRLFQGVIQTAGRVCGEGSCARLAREEQETQPRWVTPAFRRAAPRNRASSLSVVFAEVAIGRAMPPWGSGAVGAQMRGWIKAVRSAERAEGIVTPEGGQKPHPASLIRQRAAPGYKRMRAPPPATTRPRRVGIAGSSTPQPIHACCGGRPRSTEASEPRAAYACATAPRAGASAA